LERNPASATNDRFQPIADIRGMSAFDPLLTFVHDLACLKADAGEIIWTGIRN
jgi:hypothetical protein